jgi:hypothetical protein
MYVYYYYYTVCIFNNQVTYCSKKIAIILTLKCPMIFEFVLSCVVESFWVSYIRIRHYLSGCGSGSGSFHRQPKESKEALILMFGDFFSLKTDANTFKKYKQVFVVGILKTTEEESRIRIRKSVDPNPFQNIKAILQHCFYL